MSRNPKLCPMCVHFDFDGGDQGYSSMTPGSDMQIGCRKRHWTLGYNDTITDARKAMLTAETCKDYKLYVEATP